MENNLIDIKPYAKPKKGGTGNSHITYNITGADIGSDLSLRSLTANRILAEYIEANNFKGGAANFVYLVASDGSISTLRGDNLTYNSGRIDDFQSNNITTQKINVDDTATINNIYNNYLNTKEIVTDFLTVNKGAHFFEVVIDKIKSVGGTIINTATSCILDYVEPYYGDGLSAPMTGYKCYWKQTDDDERYVSNDWKVGDQAISQNCNLVAGVNHNTSNHYYWRVVSEVGNTTKYVNFDTGQVSDGVLVDGEYVAPDYKIEFNDDFLYDNLQQGDYHITIDEWTTNNTPDSWIDNTLTVKDTLHGLNLFPKEIVDINTGDPETNVTRMAWMSKGMFSFSTTKMTKLNVLFLFDDDTVEYHPIESIIAEMESHQGEADYANLNIKDGATDWYRFEIKAVTNAVVKQILITSDVVEVFHACHWIVLSDKQGEVDVPTQGTDFEIETRGWDNVPAKGDNIAQLGYRYGQNPDTDSRARASAIIIASYKTPDSDIKPPSYAQYMDITDFDLSSHRKTYFDATRFVINNADIEDTTIDIYRMVPEQNPVIWDGHSFNTGANGFEISFLLNTSGLSQNVPANMHVTYTIESTVQANNGRTGTITAGNHPAIQLLEGDVSINAILYNSSNMQVDVLEVSIITMTNLTNGANGEYDQWAYVNRVNNPGYPNENNQDNTSSTAAYPPTGTSGGVTFNWNPNPTTPSGTQNSWMTTRHISFDSSNLPVYGGWSYPLRLNGEDGQAGTDGKDFEFIYTLSQISSTEVGNPSWAPNITEPLDYTVDDFIPEPWSYTLDNITYNGDWEDHPRGISSTYMYEYMAQRYSYIDNGIKYWSYFTTPILWSKWGENGQDGDGVKYVFRKYKPVAASGSTSNYTPIFSGNGYPNDALSRADQYNNIWYDNSMEPDATGDVYCSQSTNYQVVEVNGAKQIFWTDFRTPDRWLKYVQDGQTGATGAQGDPGEPGEGYILTPVKRTWEVALTEVTNQTYENLASVVTADLEYKISHWRGDDQIEEVDLTSGDGFSVKAIVKDGSGTTLKTYTLTKNLTYDKFTLSISNVLQDIGGHGWSNYNYNYRRIITEGDSTAVDSLPVTLEVQLLDGQSVINNDIRTLITEGKGLFISTNSALQSVYQGVGATGPTQYSNYFTNLQQTMKGIELSAAEAIIGADGAFTTFGSDHLPQSTTEKCFLTAYTSSSSWPGGGAISIYDSSTPTGVYNNTGTVCYDGSSYWNSSTSMPTLSASASYLWMVRGYRTYDSSNSTYTPWKTNTPVLWGVYDPDGTIYNNANLAITARSIKNSVSSITQNYATKAELEVTADRITSTVESISNAKDNLLEDTTFDSVAATVTTGAWQQTTGSGTVNGLSDTTEQYQGSNCLIFDSRGSGSTSSLISIEQFVPVDIFDSGEPYTLSVYVKKLTNNGSNEFGLLGWTIPDNNIIDYTNMSGSAGPSETNVTVNGTGPYYNYGAPRVSWFINDNEWHRLFITFKNIAAYSSGKALIGIRNWKSGSIGNQYLVSMPKLEKGSTPSLWVPGTVDNKALKSEISQTATTVSITALNTIINGDLDLHGTFTSDDQENMNKCIIDSENGGIKIYGPSSINDSTGKPASGATYKQYMDLTWTQDENGHRYGLIALNTRNTNDNPSKIHAILLDDTGFDMYTTEKRLNFNCDTINYAEYDSGGETVKSCHVDWLDITARLTDYRIIDSGNYGSSLWRVNEVNDVYIFDNSVASINWNSSSPFEIGSGTAGNDGGYTKDYRIENRHLYNGRTITIKPVNGLKIHNEDGYIITKGTAWTGGYGTPTTGSQTITFNGNNSASTHDYFPMKLIRHDGYWIEI